MSLTIFPQAFAAGFNPKAPPTVSTLKQAAIDLKEDTRSAKVDVQVDLSHLKTIKIIPEEET